MRQSLRLWTSLSLRLSSRSRDSRKMTSYLKEKRVSAFTKSVIKFSRFYCGTYFLAIAKCALYLLTSQTNRLVWSSSNTMETNSPFNFCLNTYHANTYITICVKFAASTN